MSNSVSYEMTLMTPEEMEEKTGHLSSPSLPASLLEQEESAHEESKDLRKKLMEIHTSLASSSAMCQTLVPMPADSQVERATWSVMEVKRTEEEFQLTEPYLFKCANGTAVKLPECVSGKACICMTLPLHSTDETQVESFAPKPMRAFLNSDEWTRFSRQGTVPSKPGFCVVCRRLCAQILALQRSESAPYYSVPIADYTNVFGEGEYHASCKICSQQGISAGDCNIVGANLHRMFLEYVPRDVWSPEEGKIVTKQVLSVNQEQLHYKTEIATHSPF